MAKRLSILDPHVELSELIRECPISLRRLAQEAGVPPKWLEKVRYGTIKQPGYDRSYHLRRVLRRYCRRDGGTLTK